MEFTTFEHGRQLRQRRELFDDAFPANNGTPAGSAEHYRWKFQQTPFTPKAYEYAALEDGRMIGYYAALPYRYRIGDREVVAGMVCDVMTHSRARRKGVFTKLGTFAIRELHDARVAFLTGYPVTSQVISGHLKVGWHVAFELPTYVKPLRMNAILQVKHVPWLAPVANGVITTYQALQKPRPPSGYDCEVGSARELLRSPAVESFLESWAASVRNHLVKTADFYDWRLAAPGTHYQAFLIYHGSAVVAAAVGRPSHLRGVPCYALLDAMVLKNEQDALATLYQRIDREARRRGAEAIVTMMSRYRAREYRLTRFGFFQSPYRFKLIVRPLGEEITPEQVLSEQNWHLMWIDSDDL